MFCKSLHVVFNFSKTQLLIFISKFSGVKQFVRAMPKISSSLDYTSRSSWRRNVARALCSNASHRQR